MARVAPLNTIEGHIEVPELKPGPGPGPIQSTMPKEVPLTTSKKRRGWRSRMKKIIPFRLRLFFRDVLSTGRSLADGSAFEMWLEEFKEENYSPKALGIFPIELRIRKKLIFTVEHLWFDNLVVLLICINCVFIATTDPRTSASDPYLKVLDRVETTFTILFVFEMILKILAFGFFRGEKTYLSDPWNSMDCIIVVTGIFTILQGSQNLAAIRLFRILRPLRLLTNIEGLRVLVMGFARAIPLLLNALFLLIFLCLMFGLFGVQLFSGKLKYQCIKEWADVLYQEEGHMLKPNQSTYFPLEATSYSYLDSLEIYRTSRDKPFHFRLIWDNKKQNVWKQLNNPMDRSSNVTGFEFEPGALDYPHGFHGLRPSENTSLSFMVGAQADGKAGETFVVGQHLKTFTDGRLIGPALDSTTTLPSRSVRLQANTMMLDKSCVAIRNETACVRTGACRWVHRIQLCGGGRYAKPGREPSKQNRCHETCIEEGFSCLQGEKPNFSYTCFENLLWGFAAIYQCITMEGWSEIMILSWDATGSAIVPAYFLVLIFVGSFFVINLTLVAIKAKLFNSGTIEVTIRKYSEVLYKKVKAKKTKGKCKRLQIACFKMISHPWFNRVFMTLIIINTIILACEKYGMDPEERAALTMANLILTVLFGIEMVVKIIGLSLKAYCKDTFNLFDGVIAIVSIVEVSISSGTVLSSSRIVRLVRLLRMFRVLRVVKLVRYLETLQRLIWVISCSMRSIGYIYLLLALFMLIFAILGVQLFAGKFVFNESLPYVRTNPYWKPYYNEDTFYTPRSNFDTLPNAFITVFQILTLEDWDVIMFNGMRSLSPVAILYFMAWTMIGVYFLLNMVLAIVLQKFEEDQKIQLEKRLQEQRLAAAIKQHRTLTRNCLKNSLTDILRLETQESMDKKIDRPSSWRLFCACRRDLPEDVRKEREIQLTNGIKTKIKRSRSQSILQKLNGKKDAEKRKQKSVLGFAAPNPKAWSKLKLYVNSDKKKKSMQDAVRSLRIPFCPDKALGKDEEDDDVKTFRDANGNLNLPQNCDFTVIGVTDHIFYGNCIHVRLSKLVTSDMFQKFIMVLIVLSSITLVFEAPNNSPHVVNVLRILDTVFTLIFFSEMLVNIFVMGLVGMPESYLSNPWNVLDFVIVSASTINLLFTVEARNRIIRVLLAFRPLRLLSRSEGMRVVIFALFHSMPAIINVIWVIILVWTIFAILGVQIFSGRFHYCDKILSSFMHFEGNNDMERCRAAGGNWKNPEYHFDDVFNAILALFVVSSLESWPLVMYSAMDITEANTNPKKESTMFAAVYFIIFIIFSTFFLISLLVGVVFDNFVKLRDEQMGLGFLTSEQKNWVQTQLMVANASPLALPIPPGRTKENIHLREVPGPEHMRMPFYRIASNPYFEQAIIFCIVLNVLLMCMFHEGIDPDFLRGLEYANSTFTVIYVIEMLIKLLGFGVRGYFMNNWNKFDFLICCGAVIDEVLDLLNEGTHFFDVTLLRVFRVSRLVRLVKSADRLKTLLRTLILSLPSVANVVTLLFLMYFVFAVLGVNLFANIDLDYPGDEGGEPLKIMDSRINFRHFGSAILTLFIVSTGDKWTLIMEDAGNYNAGGIPKVNILYFLVFYIVVNFITLNLFIAIILDNFTIVSNSEKDREDVDKDGNLGSLKLTDDMVQQFTETWAQFDPSATRLVPWDSMLPLLQAINPPLGLGQGGKMTDLLKLTRNMMIPIHEANFIHFGELLYALSENLCGANLPDKTRIAQKITRKLKKKLPMWGQPLQISFGVWLAVIKAQKMWKRIIAERKLIAARRQRQEKKKLSPSKLRVLSRYKGPENTSLDTFSGSPIPTLERQIDSPDAEFGDEDKTINESTLQADEKTLLAPNLNKETLPRHTKLPNQARISEPRLTPGVTESSPGLIKCSIIPDGPPNGFEKRENFPVIFFPEPLKKASLTTDNEMYPEATEFEEGDTQLPLTTSNNKKSDPE